MPVASKIKVDFTNVKERGEFSNKALPEGDYIAKITDVNEGQSNAGNPQLIFKIEIPSIRAASYPYYCGLEEKQMWKLRTIALAAGMEVPKKRLALDVNRLIGKEIGIELMDDEYEGRVKSKIVGIFPKDEVSSGDDIPDDSDADDEDDDDFEDEPAPKKRAAKKKPAPEPEDDDEDDEDEEPAPAPKRRKSKPAPEPEEDEEDDDEEEEEPAPRRKKAPAKKRKPAPVDDDEDEDEMDIDEI